MIRTTNSPSTRVDSVPSTAPPVRASTPPPPAAASIVTNAPANVAQISTQVVVRPRPMSNKAAVVLDAQVALDRLAFSPGSIDGVLGSQTRSALRAFQAREGLAITGDLDTNTLLHLSLASPALTTYEVTGAEPERLHPIATTWLGKSEQERLDYETLVEMLGERGHAHPNLVRRLNPGVDWNNVAPGTQLVIPATDRVPPRARAARVRIRLSQRTLEAFDDSDGLLAHFPCSIAQRVEKRPVGELHVAVTAPGPNYTFDPEVFPESAEARELGRKLILPPGPNNPVGTVWIGLDKPGYGIHGTPRPEDVGRTESHGCFRLANWNAEYLLRLIAIGTPVIIEP